MKFNCTMCDRELEEIVFTVKLNLDEQWIDQRQWNVAWNIELQEWHVNNENERVLFRHGFNTSEGKQQIRWMDTKIFVHALVHFTAYRNIDFIEDSSVNL